MYLGHQLKKEDLHLIKKEVEKKLKDKSLHNNFSVSVAVVNGVVEITYRYLLSKKVPKDPKDPKDPKLSTKKPKAK